MNQTTPTTAIVRGANNLTELASAINREAESTVEHARSAGELLLRAKRLVPHGQWKAWLTANVRFAARTAQKFMQIASRWDELHEVSNAPDRAHLTSVNGALAVLSAPDDEAPDDTKCVVVTHLGTADKPAVLPFVPSPEPEPEAKPKPAARTKQPKATQQPVEEEQPKPEEKPHPYEELRARCIALTKDINAALNADDGDRLRIAAGLVGIVDHTPGGRVELLPLLGLPVVLASAVEGEERLDHAELRANYENAARGWVPPAIKKWRAEKAAKKAAKEAAKQARK